MSEKCVIVTGNSKFEITDAKLYVPVVTLSAQDNEHQLQQLKIGFKRTINWNKYQSEPTIKTRNRYLNHLLDPSFQGVNKLFVLSFENNAHRRNYKVIFSSNFRNKRLQCYG